MLGRLIESFYRILAQAVPPRIAYHVALRVLHEAADHEYKDSPHSKIRALDTLRVWNARRFETRQDRARRLNPNLYDGMVPRGPGGPIFDRDSVYDGGATIRPRDLAPGEMLAEGEIPTAAQVLAEQEVETARGLNAMAHRPSSFSP